jgi:phosphoketolase
MPDIFSKEQQAAIHAYWRAANYLSIGQIYLYDNPLLKEPLKLGHIKPRLLGHWGTTPGLNFIYVHLNRLIKARDLNVIYIAGPGHGGPGLVANSYLEGTYTEVYPNISQDTEGMKKLFKQFSFPGGIPSHVAPETPGSIHEGGELGYSAELRKAGIGTGRKAGQSKSSRHRAACVLRSSRSRKRRPGQNRRRTNPIGRSTRPFSLPLATLQARMPNPPRERA